MISLELTLAPSIGLIGAVALARRTHASIRNRSTARKAYAVLSGTSHDTARDAAYARIDYEVSRDFTPAELAVLACCRAAKETF